MKIRKLNSDEWLLLKQLRLNALKTDPKSFWETYSEAQVYPDKYWKELAANLTAKNGSRMFMIGDIGEISGFVYGINNAPEIRLGGLWVEPCDRKKGLGKKLVKQVVGWATELGAVTSLKLWSPLNDTIVFYNKLGFSSLEHTKTHPEDGRKIVEMEYGKPFPDSSKIRHITNG